MRTNRPKPKGQDTPDGGAKRDDSSPPDSWQSHEHLATPVQIEAQKLLEQAGSSELAKHAVDSAAQAQPHGSPQDEFARRLGFASYLSLFEDSALLTAEAGKRWFATALRKDEWVLWNDVDLEVVGSFPAREAAERAVPEPGQS